MPDNYVASEETALVRWLNGGPARPTSTPPRPFEKGVAGRPTLVDNVETLAHMALIARHGAEWFRSAGAPEAPGTALFTIDGAVTRPGVYELPLGTPLTEVLRAAGGPARELQSVLAAATAVAG
jgi:NADH:ubiquinone oxidoreductase, NADH-binding (51 kD) subunit